MIIEEAIDKFAAYISTERRMAAGTVENYTADLADLAQHLHSWGVDEVEDLRSVHLRQWEMLHIEQGEAPGTVRRRLSSLRSWLRYLRKAGVVKADLMARVSSPKVPKRLPVFYREQELEHLYDEGIFANDFMGRRDALMLRMLYETGMRRSELAGLTLDRIDLHSLQIKVLGKRNKERIIPIETELAHNISDYLALKEQTVGATEWLFVNAKGKPITDNVVYNTVRKYMTALSSADRISPHVFRHSFATHMLSEGAGIRAIQELLGHADLSSTEVYTHVTRSHLKEVYSHAFPRGRQGKQKKD